MHTYSIKGKRGQTDLQSIYAFVGSSQGDSTATNDVEAYKNSEGWLQYVFGAGVDKYNQEAINIEALRRAYENDLYVQSLIDEGRYGEEYETKMSVMPNPLLDNPTIGSPPTESSQFLILDLSKQNQ